MGLIEFSLLIAPFLRTIYPCMCLTEILLPFWKHHPCAQFILALVCFEITLPSILQISPCIFFLQKIIVYTVYLFH